jgi:HK97 family phage major capsid protein
MELSFKGIADHLDQMDKQSVERIKSINEKMESLSKQVESGQTIVNEWGELVAQVKSHAEDMKALNDFADTMQKSLKKKEEEEKSANFNSVIESLIKDNHEKIKSGKNGQLLILNNENYSFQKDMSFGGNTTGSVIAPDFDRNLYGPPFQVPHIRNFVRVGRTSSPAYYYIVATLKSGAAASTAPGDIKPEIQYQFDGKIANVIKIAAHLRAPEEMFEDIEGLTTFVQNYSPEEIFKTEDTEMLTGDGTTGHFHGIIPQATVHVPSTGVDPNEPWDLLANAIAIQQNKWFPPNRSMVNPINWFFMATRKSADGIYSVPTLITGSPLVVAGMPVTPHPKIVEDTYLVGDFTKAELKLKTGLSLRFFEQDRDNAIRNMVTVVVEERAAFVVYYPDAFLKGDFNNLS